MTEVLQNWTLEQKMFWVATAGSKCLVNVSPKGLDGSLVYLDTRSGHKCTLAYYDTGGSGIETIAHLRENGRITLMFSAFDGPPKIVRFYGKGRSVTRKDSEFDELLPLF